uniref:Prominin 1 n=1 Tax=Cercocebus atys TaxID=9531 RepID=A0A2K5MEJ5_CERAT
MWWRTAPATEGKRTLPEEVLCNLPLGDLYNNKHWHLLWFCGKSPGTNPDQKESETGRQQFQGLANSLE